MYEHVAPYSTAFIELVHVLWLGYNKVWLLSTILLLKEKEVLNRCGIVVPLKWWERRGGRGSRHSPQLHSMYMYHARREVNPAGLNLAWYGAASVGA